MAARSDPKGYYARLGIAPSATASEIKAAYRRLVKNLHPDINRDGSAKGRFQAINEAYSVLSDADLRAAYDALQYTSPDRQKPDADLEPICCSHCGKVTAQPRSAVFYMVISVVLLTIRTPMQGIFCSACARRTALRATLISTFFGWWGVPWGPIWTIASIYRNAMGGRCSRDVNDKLLWYNALAFLSKGKLAISYALAKQVRTARDTEIALNAAKLMDHLRVTGVSAASPMLKNPWRRNPLTVAAHLALFAAVPGVIGVVGYLDSAKTRETTSVPTCASPPDNGETLIRRGSSVGNGHSIEIKNGSSGNAIVKVRNAYTGSLLVSFFVAKASTASIANVPDGSYRIQYAHLAVI
jgi:hypothetical protein